MGNTIHLGYPKFREALKIKEFSLPENNGYWMGIKLILKNYIKATGRQIGDSFNTILSLLHKIIHINKGLTCAQAALIYNTYKHPESNTDWRFQHLLNSFLLFFL